MASLDADPVWLLLYPPVVSLRASMLRLQYEYAERRKNYTEYVPFGASFGIHVRIPEYVWNTAEILRIPCMYGKNTALLAGLPFPSKTEHSPALAREGARSANFL